MLNIEKYADEIKELDYKFAMKKGVLISCDNVACYECGFGIANNKEDCTINRFKWLSKEYEEHDKLILAEKEKRIILNIIDAFKPFGDELKCIAKYCCSDDPKKYYLNFNYRNYEFDTFIFNDELFAGMEVDKDYTLEELGL